MAKKNKKEEVKFSTADKCAAMLNTSKARFYIATKTTRNVWERYDKGDSLAPDVKYYCDRVIDILEHDYIEIKFNRKSKYETDLFIAAEDGTIDISVMDTEGHAYDKATDLCYRIVFQKLAREIAELAPNI